MAIVEVQHRAEPEKAAHFVDNAIRLVRNPRMAALYLRWWATQMALHRSPIHYHHGKMRIGNFFSFSHYWMWRDGISAAEMRVLEVCHYILPRDQRWIAVDVGAHLGHFALALAAIGFDEVHAFEPIPHTYRHLLENIALNAHLADSVTAHRLGVSDSPGSTAFSICANSPGQNRIATANNQYGSHHIHCPLTSLDEQFAHRTEALLGIVKIDVEGFETSVIRGATRLLAEGRIMFVYAEVIPQALREAGSSTEELVATLNLVDLIPVRIVPAHGQKFIGCTLNEALASNHGTRNVLFARKAVLQQKADG